MSIAAGSTSVRQPIALAPIGMGIAMLGYSAFVSADAWTFQQREGREMERRAQSASSAAAHRLHRRYSSASVSKLRHRYQLATVQ
jgi:hypothetical protein